MYRAVGAADPQVVFTTAPAARTTTSPVRTPPKLRAVKLPPPTADELMYRMAAQTACPTFHTAPCLDRTWSKAVMGCVGRTAPPPGVTRATWTAFCRRVGECSTANKPACGPATAPPTTTTRPPATSPTPSVLHWTKKQPASPSTTAPAVPEPPPPGSPEDVFQAPPESAGPAPAPAEASVHGTKTYLLWGLGALVGVGAIVLIAKKRSA